MDALLGGHLPDLDGAVGGARDEVLVVGREGHAQHPARVARQRRDQAPVTPGKEREKSWGMVYEQQWSDKLHKQYPTFLHLGFSLTFMDLSPYNK